MDSTTLAYAGDTLWVLIEKALRHFHWADSIDSDLTKKMQVGGIGNRQQIDVNAGLTSRNSLNNLSYPVTLALTLPSTLGVPAPVPADGELTGTGSHLREPRTEDR